MKFVNRCLQEKWVKQLRGTAWVFVARVSFCNDIITHGYRHVESTLEESDGDVLWEN
jgi:hypothetical protein